MDIVRVSDFWVSDELVHDSERWPVFDRYVISGEDVLALISETVTIKAVYNPFLERSLFGEFAKVEPSKDHKKLMRFVHKYGLPGLTSPENRNLGVRDIGPNKINLIYEMAEAFRQAFRMWEIIQSEDNKEAECMLNTLRTYAYIPELGDRLSSGFTAEKAMDLLAWRLSHMIDIGISIDNLEIVPGFSVHKVKDRYEYYQTWKGRSLSSIAWMQFAFMVMGERRVKRCQECGGYFEQRRSNQRFCPPTRGGVRSTCENNHTKREARRKRNKH